MAQDPRKMYHTGEYTKQYQAPPGVQGQMQPQPDCGEESYTPTGRLRGLRALVTGGDSGIGRAAAIAFGKEGADVALCYLPSEQADAEEVKAVIEQAGQKAHLAPCDLRDEASARQMVDQSAAALGGLDILVLNAGEQHAVADIADMDMQRVHSTFTTNIISMYYTVQQALPHMAAGGSIITTSSVEAYAPDENLLDYAATKAAIVGFTKGLAKQLAKRGIRVNSVAPGPIWTPLQISGGQPQEALPGFGSTSPLQRAGQPVELADVYVFLASDRASYVTGQVYGVTGGLPTG